MENMPPAVPSTPSTTKSAQVMMLLVGFVGSGKVCQVSFGQKHELKSTLQSTFAEALAEYAPVFKRCNQDELGSRQKVEGAVRAALRSGYSVCVDRTNIDRKFVSRHAAAALASDTDLYHSQRANWVDIASQFSDVEVWCVEMDTPYEESFLVVPIGALN